MSRHKLRKINKDRAAQAVLRRARVLKLSALGKSTSEIAEAEGCAVKTVRNNLAIARKEAGPKAEAIREEAEQVLRGLLSFITDSEEMTDKEIVDAIRSTWKDLREMHGADQPSKSIVGHVSGPALDTWVLDAHKILHDCESDEEKQAALDVMREYVTSRRKVVIHGELSESCGTDQPV